MTDRATATEPRAPLWRERRFGTYWAGQAVSQLGDRVSELALPLTAVTVLGATATEVGLLTAAVWLPNLLALVMGSWVDRQNRRRRVLVATDLARAGLVLTVPAAYAVGLLTLPQLFVVALLVGSAATLYQAAWQPFFVTLVRRERYVEANSLLSSTRSRSFVAGPALGGALVQLFTAPFALLVDGVSFLVSATLLNRVRVTERPPQRDVAQETLRQRVGEGLRIVRPVPIHRATRPASRAPTTPPRAPRPSASPMVPADSPRVRFANTSTTALTMKVKAFTQVTHRRAGARYGWWRRGIGNSLRRPAASLR